MVIANLARLGLKDCQHCADPYDPRHSDARTSGSFCSEDCETEHYFRLGRSRGAADRLLGERSPVAETSTLPGYADGYRAGRRGD